jgi:hypothetical protein
MEQRGLSEEVIKTAHLGFNPQTRYEQWGQTQVYLSRGIVIPRIQCSHASHGFGHLALLGLASARTGGSSWAGKFDFWCERRVRSAPILLT